MAEVTTQDVKDLFFARRPQWVERRPKRKRTLAQSPDTRRNPADR